MRVAERDGKVQVTSDNTALLERPGRSSQVMTSIGVPLRAKARDGSMRPVDLELVDDGGSLVPNVGLVPTAIARRAGDGVQVGAIRLSLVGAGDVSGVATGGQVQFANVAQDADLVVATQPWGVETYSVPVA